MPLEEVRRELFVADGFGLVSSVEVLKEEVGIEGGEVEVGGEPEVVVSTTLGAITLGVSQDEEPKVSFPVSAVAEVKDESQEPPKLDCVVCGAVDPPKDVSHDVAAVSFFPVVSLEVANSLSRGDAEPKEVSQLALLDSLGVAIFTSAVMGGVVALSVTGTLGLEAFVSSFSFFFDFFFFISPSPPTSAAGGGVNKPILIINSKAGEYFQYFKMKNFNKKPTQCKGVFVFHIRSLIQSFDWWLYCGSHIHFRGITFYR